MSNFANELKKKRTDCGWTLAYMSNKTGVPLRTLENWESGTRTPPHYVQTLLFRELHRLSKNDEQEDATYTAYRIIHTTEYFKKLSDIRPGASLSDEDAVEICRCESFDHARSLLKLYRTSVECERTFYGSRYVLKEYHIEEYQADEDGEFVSGSNFDSTSMEGCSFNDTIGEGGFVMYVGGKWTYTAEQYVKKGDAVMKDFEILTEAYQSHPTRKGMDKGHIVRYDGDLYFVFDPNERHNINYCESWTFDVEKHFCFNDVDTDSYKYYHTDGFLKPIDFKKLIK